jgi:hypothetical protein
VTSVSDPNPDPHRIRIQCAPESGSRRGKSALKKKKKIKSEDQKKCIKIRIFYALIFWAKNLV